MKVDYSFKIYPRPDQEFKKKCSLDIQRCHSNIYKTRPTGSYVQAYLWILCFVIGALVGTTAFLLDIANEKLYELRWYLVDLTIFDNPGLGWTSLVTVSIGYVLISSSLCVFVAPTAIGSGVAEAMGILNGVAYPGYIGVKVFLCKFFGLTLAVAGGICGGKEGPLIHMGGIIGYAVPYIPIIFTKNYKTAPIFKYFQCDIEKRKLLAVGAAAGVSAAFGAPIGGSLFAYEISRPNTFWSFSLTWKVFFASSISTFTLSIWQ